MSILFTTAPHRTHRRTTSRRDRAMSVPELTSLVAAVADDTELWKPLVHIPEHGAQRWWTRLISNERVDVWLLTWLPGHDTDLHDHGGSTAAFTVVQGELAEVRVDSLGQQVDYHRTPGAVTWMPPGVVHGVTGAGTGPAVSIHAYSSPLRSMTYYERGFDGRLHAVHTARTRLPEI
jgi:quercetin dioxygenase-like cupin family protein